MFWFWLFLFGVAIGIVSGLLGIGGGVLLVPGLILLFGMSQPEAQGTSLAVLIPPIGIFAALVYYQAGHVRVPVVGALALGIMVGALCGAKLVPYLSPTILRTLFALLMFYLGFVFVLNPSGKSTGVALPAGVAAIVTTLLGRLWGRKLSAKNKLPPPGSDHEYQI